jgi:hypothetical protein
MELTRLATDKVRRRRSMKKAITIRQKEKWTIKSKKRFWKVVGK